MWIESEFRKKRWPSSLQKKQQIEFHFKCERHKNADKFETAKIKQNKLPEYSRKLEPPNSQTTNNVAHASEVMAMSQLFSRTKDGVETWP